MVKFLIIATKLSDHKKQWLEDKSKQERTAIYAQKQEYLNRLNEGEDLDLIVEEELLLCSMRKEFKKNRRLIDRYSTIIKQEMSE